MLHAGGSRSRICADMSRVYDETGRDLYMSAGDRENYLNQIMRLRKW